MKAISFNLSGKFAHFKKPDVNSYAYFTYSHIHKVALFVVLGTILGLKGYGNSRGNYLEFYEKLKDFKVFIIPKKPYFTKKIITFNNSVGYASKEEGGNLIVKEIELKKPTKDLVCASLIPKSRVTLKKLPRFGENFFYSEFLPIKLKEKFLIYEYEEMILSSWVVECGDKGYFEYEGKGVWFG